MKCICSKKKQYGLIKCGATPLKSAPAHHLNKDTDPEDYKIFKGDFDRVTVEIMWGPGTEDYNHPTTKVKTKFWRKDPATGSPVQKWLFDPADVIL